MCTQALSIINRNLLLGYKVIDGARADVERRFAFSSSTCACFHCMGACCQFAPLEGLNY